jgi:uncharacterized protein (DUF302 family)
MKIDTNKSSSQVGSWVKKALYGSAVLGLAMAMGTTTALAASDSAASDNGAVSLGFGSMTPYSRVAKVPVVKVRGKIDYKATYAKARAASLAIATYVAQTVEADLLGSDVIQGIDWKLGGTSKECLDNPTGIDPDTEEPYCTDDMINHNVIMIPSPDPINPLDEAYLADGTVTKANTKKANMIEFCNSKYASMAMGVAPIIGDKKIANGWAHAPALPCEVSVWNDDQHIYVDMLDPSAIFTLFFSDTLFSENMQDPAFAEALYAMPPQVKAEIVAIIHAALAEFDPNTSAMDQKIGPVYDSIEDIIEVVDASPLKSPYKHMIYTKENGVFVPGEDKIVAQTIINTMSIHGAKDEDGNDIAGKHPTVIDEDTGATLDSILSPKSSWRSARTAPITIPGKNHIIEACSPKYAKEAMATGLHHVNALPCEITVKLLGDGSLAISYLDPAFMLGAMFSDVEMTKEERDAFFAITEKINTDLQNIVRVALDVNLELDSELNEPERKFVNMLPSEE